MSQRWIRSSTRQPLTALLVGALILWTCAVTYGLAAGRLLLTDAVFYVAGPWVALAAAFRPDWLLLALIAMPASVTVEVPLTRLLLLVGIALGALMANDSLMLNLAYYSLTTILAFNLSLLGELRPDHLASAFIVGVFSTLAL